MPPSTGELWPKFSSRYRIPRQGVKDKDTNDEKAFYGNRGRGRGKWNGQARRQGGGQGRRQERGQTHRSILKKSPARFDGQCHYYGKQRLKKSDCLKRRREQGQ